MAGKGPSPTPTGLLLLRGSRRARRRAGEPAGVSGAIRPPSTLAPDERAAFRDLVSRAPWVTRSDVPVLALAARLSVATSFYARQRREQGASIVRRDDRGTVVAVSKAPWASLELEASTQLRAVLGELGLSPSARTRVKAEAASEPASKLQAFLRSAPRRPAGESA